MGRFSFFFEGSLSTKPLSFVLRENRGPAILDVRRTGPTGASWPNLAANMARIAVGEHGEGSETVFAEEDAARNTRDRFTVTVRRRVRYWTDGAVIGSELFVREVAATLTDAKRALRKRLAKGTPPSSADTPRLFACRRLDPTL
jgi:hypothetical protein